MATPPKIRPWFWNVITVLWMATARVRLRLEVRFHGAPAPGEAVVLAGKHASAIDIVLMGVLARKRTRRRPFFQMGSFIGYRVLGRIKPFLRPLGGFEVMRPKEVRRLSKISGWDRASSLEHMRRVNEDAESVRQGVLRNAGILAVFPEGTRDEEKILPLASQTEFRSALAVAGEGTRVAVWPVVVALGRYRVFRRRCRMEFLDPFPLDPAASSEELLVQVGRAWRAVWLDPDALDADGA